MTDVWVEQELLGTTQNKLGRNGGTWSVKYSLLATPVYYVSSLELILENAVKVVSIFNPLFNT